MARRLFSLSAILLLAASVAACGSAPGGGAVGGSVPSPLVGPADGGNTPADTESPSILPPPSSSESSSESESPPSGLDSVERLIYSESYAGHLVIHFDEKLGVRVVGPASIVSTRDGENLVRPVRAIVAAEYPLAQFKASIEGDPEGITARRLELERLSGENLADFNSIVHVVVADRGVAARLLSSLREEPAVARVYPAVRPYPSGIATTPSLTGWQTYLLDEASYGGLNAAAAWARGVRGEGVYVVDNESGINFGHEDLGLVAKRFYDGGNYIEQPECAPGFPPELQDCDAWIAHGTAVAGILVAEDNGHGVTGFAPSSYYLNAAIDSATFIGLRVMTDGIDGPNTHGDDDVEPGSIWVIEVQLAGKFSNGTCSGSDGSAQGQLGCVPTEMWPEDFDAIKMATAYGVTVISGSGNGQTDLDDPNLYTGAWTFAHDLSKEDAGSIMVGASQGANEQKISFSNCGSRVNSFAWGAGVVTTAYPYAFYKWYGTTPPVPQNSDANNFYTDIFGGTSSAAAMVGGAAALLQSHARAELGHKRYLMPTKMREIMVNSGVPQKGGGCNIGKQPRLDVALGLADDFLAEARQQYPELDSGQALASSQEMIELRKLGIGIICGKADAKEHKLMGFTDPICPEEELWPVGNYIAKDLDFDGDARADLVQWTNGTWRLDLSSRGPAGVQPGGDNFGAWDIEIAHAPIAGRWVWPYVADMNSDGREDFVSYDKEHGKFYIAYTDTELIEKGTWHGWDRVVDYSAEWTDVLTLDPFGTDPNEPDTRYSRPALGDYNGDGWVDIAIACSDGIWRIDYNGADIAKLGGFDEKVKYLSDIQLQAAPGWGYLAAPSYMNGDDVPISIGYKVPDGVAEAGRFVALLYDFATDMIARAKTPYRYGGNDEIPLPGGFSSLRDGGDVSLKNRDGSWPVSFYSYDDYTWHDLVSVAPDFIFGDFSCHPAVGDFDGDGKADRAVMCPDEWRIAYSSPSLFPDQRAGDGSRRVVLGYDSGTFSLPGRSYSGGVSYAYVKQMIEFFESLYPKTPPPIPVDMITTSGCLPGQC